MGLHPDGIVPSGIKADKSARWTRAGAMKTIRFQTQLVAFGLGMMVQIAFLSHHVSMIAPSLGEQGASLAVSGAAISAFAGGSC